MVLMIDDDTDALEIYNMLIGKNLSEHFVTKDNGRSALEFLSDIDKRQAFFPLYILLDLNMPGFDGVDFVEAYEKDLHQKYPDTAIMVLTSSVREKDNEKILNYASVSSVMSKPITKEQLAKLIQNSI